MNTLAIDGGKPVRKKPFPPRVMFDEKELRVVTDLMKKGMKDNTQKVLDRYSGKIVDTYEKEFAEYFGVKFATAVSSGTAAIHSALGALQLDAGSEVITTPITDPGGVMPIMFQNLVPVFADVDYHTLNITAEAIEKVITKRTKAIIVVHLAGVPCEMDKIMKLANKYNLIVIEDCAQAHGSLYKNNVIASQRRGNLSQMRGETHIHERFFTSFRMKKKNYEGKFVGTFGDMGVFSLMSGKHTTSGGQGGMVITDNEGFYWNAKRFADRGKPFGIDNPEGNLFPGLNYRMTELEAAIGRVQLKKLRKVAKKRYQIVEKLRKGFRNLESVSLWEKPENSEPNYWFCFIRVETEKLKVSKEQFAKAVSAEGIPCGAHYVIPMYENPFMKEKSQISNPKSQISETQHSNIPLFHHSNSQSTISNLQSTINRCPNAEKALLDHMTLSIHECWGEQEIEDTIKAFEKVEKHYLR